MNNRHILKFIRWETEFKKTEIGGVPKDWEVRALGEFINVFLVNTLSFLNLHFQVCNV